jgi:hypothetical protein
MAVKARALQTLLIAVILPLSASLTGGCVTKGTAKAQARAAFEAGRQQAMQELRQTSNQVTLDGQFQTSTLPWAQDLTLTKAIVQAGYSGPDPTEILLIRNRTGRRIDPKKLLEKEDIPLQPGDIVQVK